MKLFGHTCCLPGSGSSTAVSSEERHYEDIEEMREAVKNLSAAAASTASAASPSVGQVWPLRQFISGLFWVKCIPGGQTTPNRGGHCSLVFVNTMNDKRCMTL